MRISVLPSAGLRAHCREQIDPRADAQRHLRHQVESRAGTGPALALTGSGVAADLMAQKQRVGADAEPRRPRRAQRHAATIRRRPPAREVRSAPFDSAGTSPVRALNAARNDQEPAERRTRSRRARRRRAPPRWLPAPRRARARSAGSPPIRKRPSRAVIGGDAGAAESRDGRRTRIGRRMRRGRALSEALLTLDPAPGSPATSTRRPAQAFARARHVCQRRRKPARAWSCARSPRRADACARASRDASRQISVTTAPAPVSRSIRNGSASSG